MPGDAVAGSALRITDRTSFMLSCAQLGITVTGLLVGYVAEPLAKALARPTRVYLIVFGWLISFCPVPDSSSSIPAVILVFDAAEARETAAIPPWPSTRASAAGTNRVARSPRCGRTLSTLPPRIPSVLGEQVERLHDLF